MGVHACQRAGVKLGSKVLVCGAGEDEGGGRGVGPGREWGSERREVTRKNYM